MPAPAWQPTSRAPDGARSRFRSPPMPGSGGSGLYITVSRLMRRLRRARNHGVGQRVLAMPGLRAGTRRLRSPDVIAGRFPPVIGAPPVGSHIASLNFWLPAGIPATANADNALRPGRTAAPWIAAATYLRAPDSPLRSRLHNGQASPSAAGYSVVTAASVPSTPDRFLPAPPGSGCPAPTPGRSSAKSAGTVTPGTARSRPCAAPDPGPRIR